MIRIMDIIQKKQRCFELTEEEIRFFVDGVTHGTIPDYQITALLMAIYFNGMTKGETALLAKYMAHSGDMVDLGGIKGIKADKHSTGGVGDKTTLVVAPMVAACGVRVAKMSGKGLGHTGGTYDKLASIPGMRLTLDREEFFSIVNTVGVSIIGQSGNICPADKKLYALRDVTSTVESIPLIASSIMSKKLAAGSDVILLDVKVGSGAFMKTMDKAVELARQMVDIGETAGKRTAALLTNMDMPLGKCIGNSLEVMEALDTLKGRGPGDLTELCVALAANMLALAKNAPVDECITMAKEAMDSGRALDVFARMVAAQGGDTRVIEDPSLFAQAAATYEIKAERGRLYYRHGYRKVRYSRRYFRRGAVHTRQRHRLFRRHCAE